MNLDNEYYEDKTLSVSSVRLFAQNPKRALANYLGDFHGLMITTLCFKVDTSMTYLSFQWNT